MVSELSVKQEMVFRYYIHGLSISEIAAKLNLQYDTVKSYLNIVRDKLGANHKGHAVYLFLNKYDDWGVTTA